MYINDTTQEQKTHYQLRQDNPDSSLPKSGTEIIQLDDDWYLVHTTPQPEYDLNTQRVVELAPVKTEDIYYQVWEVQALSQQEIDDIATQNDAVISDSMASEGRSLTADDDLRISVGSPGVISDRPAHDTYMQTLYAGQDAGQTPTPKPPYTERQQLRIALEDENPFTFTRYQDQWGYRWRMDLVKDSVTNLALYIQDSNGNYLYTTGALLDNGDGGWYTECPAGQADPTPEDVYFHWILGSGRISNDFLYAGTEDELSGIVRSDTRYD